MNLSFLPEELQIALSRLNLNFLTEIRIRRGQPVIIEYKGEYKYINKLGICDTPKNAIKAYDTAPIINAATGGCVYGYTEQMKSGFITVEHGVRIGLAGEYITQNGNVNTIANITSLNIRIPHNIEHCADYLFENLFLDGLHSTMLYSKPGNGKTTMLRDLAKSISEIKKVNVLIFDERNEIAAMDKSGNGFNLGDRVDVVRCSDKLSAISSAIRAMKPDVIVTDELYGEADLAAVSYAADCGICVLASSHITDENKLKKMPFEYFAHLTAIGRAPVIYDKNFIAIGGGGVNYDDRRISFCE